MKVTLESLQTEMRNSFAGISLRMDQFDNKLDTGLSSVNSRIDNLDINVNERIDRILLSLDAHMKETAYNFRNVDERFEQMDQRFEQMDQKFDQKFEIFKSDTIKIFVHYSKNLEKIIGKHEERIIALEERR